MPNTGDKCPVFSLRNQDNQLISIEDYIGKKTIIIYFYPKDNTPSCTKEACAFRDAMQNFNNLECEVFGISADSIHSHKAFSLRYNLTFQLLSDSNNLVRKQFKVPANLFGLIPGRVTYIINKSGFIAHLINSQTNPDKHIQETLDFIQKKGL